MHPIAAEQRTGMVRWSVTGGRIGIRSAPGQDRRTLDNQIASANQVTTHGTPEREHEEGLKRRRSCSRPSFAQLRRARNARLANCAERQATGQGQRGPTLQPLMHILVGESEDAF
jgi:hypothetical protein